ncbi:hypothetical protein HK104_010709 [Borealophlyctis nickersoniae]|nr:hypothetical protein HK104_010709 [Borealophlyctis nickersoniae]
MLSLTQGSGALSNTHRAGGGDSEEQDLESARARLYESQRKCQERKNHLDTAQNACIALRVKDDAQRAEISRLRAHMEDKDGGDGKRLQFLIAKYTLEEEAALREFEIIAAEAKLKLDAMHDLFTVLSQPPDLDTMIQGAKEVLKRIKEDAKKAESLLPDYEIHRCYLQSSRDGGSLEQPIDASTPNSAPPYHSTPRTTGNKNDPQLFEKFRRSNEMMAALEAECENIEGYVQELELFNVNVGH